MQSTKIAGLRLFYAFDEQDSARIVEAACDKSVHLLTHRWGLPVPADCRVYVMTSWSGFLFQSAPWPWKIYLGLTFPWVAWRARTLWPYAGGWTLHYGRRRVVGVKPLRLIQASDRSLGAMLFLPNREPGEVLQTITCHELTHAFTQHLKLPFWLNEGLATLAMERYLSRDLIRPDTLGGMPDLPEHKSNRAAVQKTVIVEYARGYWLTRYIEERQPALLADLLSKPHRKTELEGKVAAAFGKSREGFWKTIDTNLLLPENF